MSDRQADELVLKRQPAIRPFETALAAALLLLLLFSFRDSLPQYPGRSADGGCSARSSENRDISAACGQKPDRHNS